MSDSFAIMTRSGDGTWKTRCGVVSFTVACKLAQEVSMKTPDLVCVRNLEMGTTLIRYKNGELFKELFPRTEPRYDA